MLHHAKAASTALHGDGLVWLLLGFLAVLFLTVSIAACPRTVVVDVTGEGSSQILIDNAPAPTIEVARASYHTVLIESAVEPGDEAQSIIMGRPVLLPGGTLTSKDMALSKDWAPNSSDDLYTTFANAATIKIAGRVSGIRLPFLAHPHGGRVLVSCGGTPRSVQLRSDPEKWITVDALPLDRRFVAPMPATATDVAIQTSDASAYVTRVQLLQGPVKELGRWHVNESAASFRFAPSTELSLEFPFGYAASAFLLAVGTVGLSLVAAYICGRGFTPSESLKCDVAETIFLSIATGFCTLITLTTAITFLGIGLTHSILCAATLSSAASMLLYSLTRRDPPPQIRQEPKAWHTVLILSATGMVGAGGTLAPEWLSGGWYLGESFTDTYWYVNLADILTTESTVTYLTEMWYFQRLADIASLGLVSFLSFGTSLSRYVELACFLQFLLPFCVYTLCSQLALGRRVALLCCLVATFSTSYTNLFQEGYLAQFLFSHFFLWSIAVTAATFTSLERADELASTQLSIGLGVIYATCLSVYPYQFVTPLAALLACPWVCRAERRRYYRTLFAAIVSTLVFWNAGITLVYNIRQNASMLETLDGLARNIIFPFYNTFEFVEISVGCKSFYRADAWLPMLCAASDECVVSLFSYLSSKWALMSPFLTITIVGLALSGIVLTVFSGSVRVRVLGFTAFLATLQAVVMWLAGRTYPFCKQVLTLATLLPVLAVLGASQFRIVSPRYRNVFIAVSGLLLLLANTRTQIATIMSYCGRCDQPAVMAMRSHRSVINADLALMASCVNRDSLSESRVLLMKGYPIEYLGSDKDRVLLWLLRSLFFPLRMASTGPLPMATHSFNTEAGITQQREDELLESGKVDFILCFDTPLPSTSPLLSQYWPAVECDLYTLYKRKNMP